MSVDLVKVVPVPVGVAVMVLVSADGTYYLCCVGPESSSVSTAGVEGAIRREFHRLATSCPEGTGQT